MKIKFNGTITELLTKLRLMTPTTVIQDSDGIVRVQLVEAVLTWWRGTGTILFQGTKEQYYKELWLKNDSTVSLSLLEMTSDDPIHEMEQTFEDLPPQGIAVKHICNHEHMWFVPPTDADKMIRCPKCLELTRLEDRIQWHKREIDELELKVVANKLGVVHGEIVSLGNDLYLIDVNKNDRDINGYLCDAEGIIKVWNRVVLDKRDIKFKIPAWRVQP